jgi:hypothetical protein
MGIARPHPGLLPLEKVKRSQRFGIHPRLDWWMRTQQPDDSKGFSFSSGEEGRDEGGLKTIIPASP